MRTRAWVLAMVVMAGWGWRAQVSSGAEDKGQDDQAVLARLREIERRRGDVVDVRAGFVQERRTPLLRKPMVSQGRVVMGHGLTRWEVDGSAAEASVVVATAQELRVYYPADRVVEVYRLGDRLAQLSTSPAPPLGVLAEQFRLAIVKEDVEAGWLELRLTPRDEKLAEHAGAIEVRLNTGTGFVEQVTVAAGEGESTVIRFSDVQINSSVTEEDVALRLPDDVKVSRPMGDEPLSPPEAPPEVQEPTR